MTTLLVANDGHVRLVNDRQRHGDQEAERRDAKFEQGNDAEGVDSG